MNPILIPFVSPIWMNPWQPMYPLVQPAIENIAEQIYEKQSLENIEYSKDNPYTSQIIVNAIREALEKAIAD